MFSLVYNYKLNVIILSDTVNWWFALSPQEVQIPDGLSVPALCMSLYEFFSMCSKNMHVKVWRQFHISKLNKQVLTCLLFFV